MSRQKELTHNTLAVSMKLSEYLFKCVREAGAEVVFGLPGDFSIPLFRTLERIHFPLITLSHEPALGYAADAYARLKGLGVAVVTYGAGGLNMVNAVAQAYAEKSPVLVISGAPEILSRRKNLLVHHRVKTFESQKRIYDEICCASVIIERLEDAASEIQYVLNKMKTQMRPGYIEIPRDLNDCELPEPIEPVASRGNPVWLCGEDCRGMMDTLVQKILSAKNPIVYLGVEVKRLKLETEVQTLIEKLHVPFVTSMEGKSTLPETHHNFVGTYMGQIGAESVRRAMDESDLILNIGTMMSDVNLGMFSGNINVGKMVHITSEGLSFDAVSKANLTLTRVLPELIKKIPDRKNSLDERWLWDHVPHKCDVKEMTTDRVVDILNEFVSRVPSSVCLDVGDILFAANGIRADILMAPCYYASMGFAVPAALAASVAKPERRAIAVVGDGAFQMTGMEIASAKKQGLSPIVMVLNNHGYETMRQMDAKRDCYNIPDWNFLKLAEAVDVQGFRVTSPEQLQATLKTAADLKEPVLIEVVMARNSVSTSLGEMSRANRRLRGEAS